MCMCGSTHMCTPPVHREPRQSVQSLLTFYLHMVELRLGVGRKNIYMLSCLACRYILSGVPAYLPRKRRSWFLHMTLL